MNEGFPWYPLRSAPVSSLPPFLSYSTPVLRFRLMPVSSMGEDARFLLPGRFKELHQLLSRPSPSSFSERLTTSTRGPHSSSRELDPPCAPSPLRIQQRQLHQRPEPGLSHPGFQQLYEHPLPPLVHARTHAFAFALLCARENVCIVGGVRRKNCKPALRQRPVGSLFTGHRQRHRWHSSSWFNLLYPHSNPPNLNTHTRLPCVLLLPQTLLLLCFWLCTISAHNMPLVTFPKWA